MRPKDVPQEGPAAAQRAVTERIEREEFARGNIAPDAEPARPRDAATIVLARPTDDDFEVLLLKRPSTSRFAAGAFVFPGGRIDPADADSAMEARLPRSGRGAEPAAVLAALRELFEETGLLLADADPRSTDRATWRRRLLDGELSLGQIAVVEDVAFTATRLCYFARWITPARFSRRYDTRFFLAELPSRHRGFTPDLTEEIADYLWVTPEEAVQRFRRGLLPMLFPTRVTLQALAEFGTVAEVFDVFDHRDIEPLTPRLLIRGNSIRPVLPGEPGYDEADG